jgi:hypothetical protein
MLQALWGRTLLALLAHNRKWRFPMRRGQVARSGDPAWLEGNADRCKNGVSCFRSKRDLQF